MCPGAGDYGTKIKIKNERMAPVGFCSFSWEGICVCARLATAHNIEGIITDRIITGPTSVTEKAGLKVFRPSLFLVCTKRVPICDNHSHNNMVMSKGIVIIVSQ